MARHPRINAILLLAATMPPATVPALAADKDAKLPPVLRDAIACRGIAAAPDRLACYDKALAAIDQASANAGLVVLDRDEVAKTRRSLFGFSVPHLFGGNGGDADKPLDRLDTVVATAGRDADGRLVFTVEGGARWRQIDDRPSSRVQPGTKVTLHRASFGSYFADFAGMPAVRVQRDG